MTRRTRWANLAPALVREPIRSAVQTDGTAELWIYDYIDEWGGEWGVSSREVAAALALMPDATAISVRLNSPGGDYFEGVAIHGALTRHPATVTVHVDGLAASAASVIAMAGDRIVMGQGAQIMIHEARSGAYGTADEMRSTATMLDQTNDDIAGFYASHAGGDPVQWRASVRAETWYTAAQAVEAGLADEVVAGGRQGSAPAAVAAPPDRVPSETDGNDQTTAGNSPPAEAPPAIALPTIALDLAELIRSAARRDTHA